MFPGLQLCALQAAGSKRPPRALEINSESVQQVSWSKGFHRARSNWVLKYIAALFSSHKERVLTRRLMNSAARPLSFAMLTVMVRPFRILPFIILHCLSKVRKGGRDP